MLFRNDCGHFVAEIRQSPQTIFAFSTVGAVEWPTATVSATLFKCFDRTYTVCRNIVKMGISLDRHYYVARYRKAIVTLL